MNGSHRSGGRTGFAGRLYIAGLLIAVGLVVELATLFWTHPVSMTLFLCLGAVLVLAGMAIFLWSVVSGRADARGPRRCYGIPASLSLGIPDRMTFLVHLAKANTANSWSRSAMTVVELSMLFTRVGIPERMKIDRREHAVETVLDARPVSLAGREVFFDERQQPAVEFGGLGF